MNFEVHEPLDGSLSIDSPVSHWVKYSTLQLASTFSLDRGYTFYTRIVSYTSTKIAHTNDDG